MTIATGQNADADDFVGNPAPFFSIESTAGTTHSLTTNGSQKVLVTVCGQITITSGSTNDCTLALKYNGTTKHSIVLPASNVHSGGFCLQYTEVPASATANITVDTTGGYSPVLANVVITVQKLLIA